MALLEANCRICFCCVLLKNMYLLLCFHVICVFFDRVVVSSAWSKSREYRDEAQPHSISSWKDSRAAAPGVAKRKRSSVFVLTCMRNCFPFSKFQLNYCSIAKCCKVFHHKLFISNSKSVDRGRR